MMSSVKSLKCRYQRQLGRYAVVALTLSTLIFVQAFELADLNVCANTGNFATAEIIFCQDQFLGGTIPPQLGDLSSLLVLVLSRADLVGEIPSQLGKLGALTAISLTENGLNGTIPPTLGNLSNLNILSLNDNRLTGLLPSEMGQLDKVTIAAFQNNLLSGTIASQIGGMQSLEIFALFSNENVTGTLPEQIGNLSELKELFTHQCSLTGTLPVQFGKLTNLTQITVSNNDLNGTIPSEYGRLTRLALLGLDANKFSGSIPCQLGQLDSLEKGNFLTGQLPLQFGNLTQIKLLFTDLNFLDGTLPTELGKLNNIESLLIGPNRMNGSIPTEYGLLTKLEFLFLSDNFFTGTIPTEIGNLLDLKILTLMNNTFLNGTIPSELGKLTLLERLFLEDNNFSGAIPEQLSELQFLNLLTLGQNNFDFVCDCDFLRWFPDFSQKITDKYETNTCSDINEYGGTYPFQLVPEALAPCSHVLLDITEGELNARNLTIQWDYPYENELNEKIITFEPFEFVGKKFSVNALENFRKCSVDFFIPGTDEWIDEIDEFFLSGPDFEQEHDVFELGATAGFEVTYGVQGSTNIRNRECFFAGEVLQNSSIPLSYDLVIHGLSPATVYEINIRTFNLYASKAPNSFRVTNQFVFGPESKALVVKTKDDIPESPVLNFTSTAATSSEITLTWNEPDIASANGEIKSYQIICIDCPGSAVVLETDIRQLTVPNLQPNIEYKFEISARTNAPEFSTLVAQFSSRTCPSNMKRKGVETDCFAEVGSFFDPSSQQTVICESLEGLTPTACLSDAVTVENLDLLEGFWRPNVNAFTEIQRCPRDSFCGKERVNESAASGLELESQQCSLNHRGTYCFSCDDGYELSLIDGCTECDDAEKENQKRNMYLFVMLIVVVCILSLFYIIVKTAVDTSGSASEWYYNKLACCQPIRICISRISSSKFGGNVAVKLRILESFFQVLFAFKAIFYVEAENINILSDFLAFFTNLDIRFLAYSFRLECAMELNHYASLLIYTVPPVLWMFLVLVAYFILTSKYESWKKEMKQEAFNMFFLVSFLIFPGASRVIFDTFYCEDFETVAEDSEYIFQSALRSDYRTSCTVSPERIGWIVIAAIMVVIYPIGITTVYFYFLKKYEWARGQKKAEYKFFVRDLIYPYHEHRCWFEAYDLIRKLLQTSFVSMFLQFEDQSASAVALNVSSISLALLLYLQPYKKPTDFFFAIFSMVLLVLATQLDWWFETYASTDTRDKIECDTDCQISNAFNSLIYLEVFAFFFFVLCEPYIISAILTKQQSNSDDSKLGIENIKVMSDEDDLASDVKIKTFSEEEYENMKESLRAKCEALEREYQEEIAEMTRYISELKVEIKSQKAHIEDLLKKNTDLRI